MVHLERGSKECHSSECRWNDMHGLRDSCMHAQSLPFTLQVSEMLSQLPGDMAIQDTVAHTLNLVEEEEPKQAAPVKRGD